MMKEIRLIGVLLFVVCVLSFGIFHIVRSMHNHQAAIRAQNDQKVTDLIMSKKLNLTGLIAKKRFVSGFSKGRSLSIPTDNEQPVDAFLLDYVEQFDDTGLPPLTFFVRTNDNAFFSYEFQGCAAQNCASKNAFSTPSTSTEKNWENHSTRHYYSDKFVLETLDIRGVEYTVELRYFFQCTSQTA